MWCCQRRHFRPVARQQPGPHAAPESEPHGAEGERRAAAVPRGPRRRRRGAARASRWPVLGTQGCRRVVDPQRRVRRGRRSRRAGPKRSSPRSSASAPRRDRASSSARSVRRGESGCGPGRCTATSTPRPPRATCSRWSGRLAPARQRSFPEVDKAAWFSLDEARTQAPGRPAPPARAPRGHSLRSTNGPRAPNAGLTGRGRPAVIRGCRRRRARSWPVVKLDASLAKYSAVPTTSSGSPPRLSAKRCAPCSKASMSQALVTSVRNGPAMMQLTRTDGPSAWANPSRQRVHAGLGRRVGQDLRGGTDRSHTRHVDHRSSAVAHHAAAHQRGEPEHALEVEVHDLVPHGLGDRRSRPRRAGTSRRC